MKYLVSLTVAYVALLPQFYLILNENNRYDLRWCREDHLAILSAILVLGTLFYMVYKLGVYAVKRNALVDRIYHHIVALLMVAFALRAITSLMMQSHCVGPGIATFIGNRYGKISLYMALFILLSITFRWRLKLFVKKGYEILSPLLLFIVVVPMFYHVYEPGSVISGKKATARTESLENTNASDVYIILFDAWSYERTFDADGDVDLGNLKQFLSTATVYHKAYSPAKYTRVSIPRLLLQNSSYIQNLRDQDIVEIILKGTATTQHETIFDWASEEYFKMCIGYILNYPKLVGHQVDFAQLVRITGPKPGYLDKVKNYLYSQAAFLRYVGVNERDILGCKRWEPLRIDIESIKETHRLLLETIKTSQNPVMAFAHYFVPHPPWAWNRNGVKKEINDPYLGITEENYRENLEYMDVLLGEFVSALKESKKWDNSLVIISADHTWKEDPLGPLVDSYEVKEAKLGKWPKEDHDANPYHPWKHVPLVVKFPKQTARRDVNEAFFTGKDLGEIVKPALQGEKRNLDL